MRVEDKQVERTFAMVSVYSNPDKNLLKQSFDMLQVVHYWSKEALHVVDAKSISSVVILIPFIVSKQEQQDLSICAQYSQCFFVSEKPFLDFTTTTDPLQPEEADEEADTHSE